MSAVASGQPFQGDFGGVARARPRDIVRARSEQDVVDAVARANRLGVGIVARGEGHSTAGQSLLDGGIVVVTAELDRIRIEGDTAVVGAGATWQSVVRATWAHGLMPPVLTDYLGLSVGGTLSVGGVGGGSFRYGMQTDQVAELRVVTGRGDVRTCSAEKERELFDSCRAGLGQVGLLVEARLCLVRAPERVRVHRIGYDALEPFLRAQLLLAERGDFDELRGSISAPGGGPRFVIEATQYLPSTRVNPPLVSLGASQVVIEEQGFFDYADRLRALERHMHVTGTWRAHHPWFDAFLPGTSSAELIRFAMDQLDAHGLTSSHLMTYPLCGAACRTPLLPVPADPHAFLFDVLPDEPDSEALPAWRELSRRVWARAASKGARMYPIGYPMGTPDVDFEAHYGSAWPGLVAARKAHDPDGLLGRSLLRAGGAAASRTLGQAARQRLAALGHATGRVADAASLAELGEVLSAGWWDEPVGGEAAWPCDITDDGSPFELSIQIENGNPDLRLLVEPRPVGGDAVANFEAGLQVAERLRERGQADPTFLQQVAAFFAPRPDQKPRFSLWYAVHVTRRGPLLKAYLNPEIHGPEAAPELVRRALEALGMSDAWSFLQARLTPSTRIPYLSVDLCGGDAARVKVYLSHLDSDAVEAAALGSSNCQPGQALRWLQALSTREPGTPSRRTLTCHAFRRGGAAPMFTLHVPVRCHVRDDREALTRARALCQGEGATCIERVIGALAERPLESARGMITYLSLSTGAADTRMTAYLAPQLYRLDTPQLPKVARVADIRSAIALAQARYARHPFFARMERGASVSEVREVAQRLAFFIMCFQDMERIACESSTDPQVTPALREHRREDFGHERWYLADLKRLGLSSDVSDVFHPGQSVGRDVGYALVSLLRHARHDLTRLSTVLALEGAGHEFFGRFVPMVQRSTSDPSLVFFGGVHQQAEAEHQIDAWTDLFERLVDADELAEMSAAVETTFRVMTRLAQDMEDALQRLPLAAVAS